jgi:uncharacterized UPF0146 family protein
MGSYKHIETCIGEYIARHYADTVEVGIGMNMDAARILLDRGVRVRCTDIRDLQVPECLAFSHDDIFSPSVDLYEGADLIYAIRPGIEMIPPLIRLAMKIDCDLLVYHLGFETYGNSSERIECGVILHRYVKASESVKEG